MFSTFGPIIRCDLELTGQSLCTLLALCDDLPYPHRARYDSHAMMYDDIMTLLSRWNSHKAGHLPQVQERVALTDGGTMHFGHTLSADIGEMPRICVPFSHRMVVLSESRMCRPPLGLPTGSDQSALSCRCCTPHNEFLCGRPAKRRCPIQAICIGFSYVLVAKSIKRCGAGDTQLGKQCYMPPFLGNNGASCLLGANQSGTPCMVYPSMTSATKYSIYPIFGPMWLFQTQHWMVYGRFCVIRHHHPLVFDPLELSRCFVAQTRTRRFSDPLNLGVSWQGHLAVWKRSIFALPNQPNGYNRQCQLAMEISTIGQNYRPSWPLLCITHSNQYSSMASTAYLNAPAPSRDAATQSPHSFALLHIPHG